MLVSIIIPVYNAELYLEEAFQSVLEQTWKDSLEVSIFNDASNDSSTTLCNEWKLKFEECGIHVKIGHNKTGTAGGVGFAKNQAIKQCSGKYLCFLDADDIMFPDRVKHQLNLVKDNDNLLVGSCYCRIPEDSTQRYTEWSNNLTEEQLYNQIYTSFGPTLINPTWFCSREVFNTCGPFSEKGKGFPEDLAFFYQHLRKGGKLCKVNHVLLKYRYHQDAATFSVHENTIWDLRINEIQTNVINLWTSFTVWNAGKQGRKFFRSLTDDNRKKVQALCDVDEKKITKGVYNCEMIRNIEGKPYKVPIVHFGNAKPPFIICVKLNLTCGKFEENLKSLNLVEGKDYFHFS